jgi:hypothetical protein
MARKELSSSFLVLSDTQPDNVSLPAFMVSTSRGFLPRGNPIVQLPPDFDVLESILRRMPVKTADGSPGLLAIGTLGETVDKELPDLTAAIKKHASNLPLMNALYRDYSFLASAYLLEPCKYIDLDILISDLQLKVISSLSKASPTVWLGMCCLAISPYPYVKSLRCISIPFFE